MGLLVGHLLQYFERALVVSEAAVDHGQAGHGLFVSRLQFENFLKGLLGFQGVLGDLVETAEQQPTVDVFRVLLDDRSILLDGQLDHLLVDAAGAILAADQNEIDPAEQTTRVQGLRVLLQPVLQFGNGFGASPRLKIEARQFVVEHGGGGVRFDRLLVEVDGAGDVLAAVAVGGGQFAIEMPHGVVVVGVRPVHGLWRRRVGSRQNPAQEDRQRQ